MTYSALEIHDVHAGYGAHTVLHGITISVPAGSCAAIVGESGSGKTTLARVVMGLKVPTSGRIVVGGREVTSGRVDRRHNGMEMIFQDPISSLNPRRTLERIVAEPLRIRGVENSVQRRHTAHDLLERVGLPPSRYAHVHPAEISGGQAQRVAIARALAAQPQVLVCDEPVSALDASVQATVLNMLADLRESDGLALLFISHDLAVVRMISQTVHVLHGGIIVEDGHTERVISAPQHQYTRQLLAAAPTL